MTNRRPAEGENDERDGDDAEQAEEDAASQSGGIFFLPDEARRGIVCRRRNFRFLKNKETERGQRDERAAILVRSALKKLLAEAEGPRFQGFE